MHLYEHKWQKWAGQFNHSKIGILLFLMSTLGIEQEYFEMNGQVM